MRTNRWDTVASHVLSICRNLSSCEVYTMWYAHSNRIFVVHGSVSKVGWIPRQLPATSMVPLLCVRSVPQLQCPCRRYPGDLNTWNVQRLPGTALFFRPARCNTMAAVERYQLTF